MSGQLVSTLRGKVPQRAIRHLSDLPYAATIQFEAVDFGTPTANLNFATPSALRGKAINIDLTGVTEAFTADTLGAGISVGDGSDVDSFAYTGNVIPVVAVTAGVYNCNANDGSLIDGVDQIVQPGDVVTVTPIAPTGGTPGGIADLGITMLYFK